MIAVETAPGSETPIERSPKRDERPLVAFIGFVDSAPFRAAAAAVPALNAEFARHAGPAARHGAKGRGQP